MKRGKLISSVLATLGIVMISIGLVIQKEDITALQKQKAIVTKNSEIELKNMATSANTIINEEEEENTQEQEIEAVVKDNEPHVALFGGNDGLHFYRKIFEGVNELLNERALLAFEMGFDQRELMEEALQKYFPNDPYEIIKDINGKDRMLFIYRNLK